MKSQILAGKVAVVTGGSSGIGAACVRLLAKEGARVVIGYNAGQERAEALRAELPGDGHSVAHIPLEDPASHEALARDLDKEFGAVDILVNSAGRTERVAHADLERMDVRLYNDILIANAGGTFSLTRALLPLLKKGTESVVVNVSSVSAATGSGSNLAYCAAKAALETTSRSLARVFGPSVRFLSLAPASVDTDFVAGRTRDELERKAAATPLGRVVTPDDVANAVLACATQLKTATGTRIVIDGGFTL
ncbi:SDR family NAD(P)-dependent oxidoreductase [Cupriavidus sp. 2TAF22]|uniref:SDR family NAD(P)-dependent oxidoreductase n=1 Tax=unclassified Cupriavidus TaxID=2640874 RepID=UPI003F936A41